MGAEHILKIRQFLFASFNRIGYKLVKSHELDKVISEGSIIHLCRQAAKRDEQTFVHAFLPDEKLLTISCITPALDSSGRNTTHNRTVIINTVEIENALKPYLSSPIPMQPPKELPDIHVALEFEVK